MKEIPPGELRLETLRARLLEIHRILMEGERLIYEREFGQVSSRELLGLVLNHQRFAWLRALSGLLARMDERMESGEPPDRDETLSFFREAQDLLAASENGSPFEKKYFDALQTNPSAVLAHGELVRLFSQAGFR